MSQTITPVILECGHVEIRKGHCATTDCHLYIGPPRNLKAEVASMIAIGAMLIWVRVITGRGALDIIMDSLPPLFS